jgi:hypothetical protein
MEARPARGVVLCLTKHLAGYWRDIAVTTENISDHIQYGIAFGPTAGEQSLLARVTVYWASGDADSNLSPRGAVNCRRSSAIGKNQPTAIRNVPRIDRAISGL